MDFHGQILEGRLTLHKGGGSRSFMTMIMTIWWPTSGVWIYQLVTGVTSVVGVPSTHLVSHIFVNENFVFFYKNLIKFAPKGAIHNNLALD